MENKELKPTEIKPSETETTPEQVGKKKYCIYCEGGTGYHVCIFCSLSGEGVEPHLLQSGAGFGAW